MKTHIKKFKVHQPSKAVVNEALYDRLIESGQPEWRAYSIATWHPQTSFATKPKDNRRAIDRFSDGIEIGNRLRGVKKIETVWPAQKTLSDEQKWAKFEKERWVVVNGTFTTEEHEKTRLYGLTLGAIDENRISYYFKEGGVFVPAFRDEDDEPGVSLAS